MTHILVYFVIYEGDVHEGPEGDVPACGGLAGVDLGDNALDEADAALVAAALAPMTGTTGYEPLNHAQQVASPWTTIHHGKFPARPRLSLPRCATPHQVTTAIVLCFLSSRFPCKRESTSGGGERRGKNLCLSSYTSILGDV